MIDRAKPKPLTLKRLLTLILALLMVFTSTGPVLAQAQEPGLAISQQEDFEFYPSTGTITSYKGTSKDLVIPQYIDGVQVRAIGQGAFNRLGLESLVLPEGLEECHWGSFAFNNFTQIEFPSTMKKIGPYSFTGCKSLEKVHFNEGLESIEFNAFDDCERLAGQITIPSSLFWLGPYSFKDTTVISLRIAGDGSSTPLKIKNNLADQLKYILLEDPGKSVAIDYTAYCNKEKKEKITVLSYDQPIRAQVNNGKELDAWIKDNIKVSFINSYMDPSDKSGHSDIEKEIPIKWDIPEDLSYDSPLKVIGTMEEVTQASFPPIDGYVLNNPADCLETNTVELTLDLEARPLSHEGDFEFDETSGLITGYTGRDTDLIIPKEINGIAVKGIGDSAFVNKALTSLSLPEGVESIGWGAFARNDLKSIALPTTMKKLGGYSFANNKDLAQIELNEGLEEINNHSFFGCSSLRGQLVIPSTVSWIGPSCFRSSNLEELRVLGDENSAPLTLKNNLGQEIAILNLENPLKNIRVDFTSFCNNDKVNLITSDKILDLDLNTSQELKDWMDENLNIQFIASYQRAGEGSMAQLQEFKSGHYDDYAHIDIDWKPVQGPDSDNLIKVTGQMEEIYDDTFPAKPGYIMNRASDCGATNTLEFTFRVNDNFSQDQSGPSENEGPNDENLGQGQGQAYLPEDFTFQGSILTGLSQSGQVKLQSNPLVKIPTDSITGQPIKSIGPSAFEGLGLEGVILPDGLEVIGDKAFAGNKIKSLDLPASIREVGISAFANNEIEDLSLPASLTKISPGSFSTNLIKSLEIPNTVKTIGESAFFGNKLESLDIPSSVESIGPKAFQFGRYKNSGTLKELSLAEGLKEIGADAFRNHKLDQVYLPASLESIAGSAFAGNSGYAGSGQVRLYAGREIQENFNNEESLENQIIVYEPAIQENYQYTLEDFIYEGHKITGFSESGLNKFKVNKDLVLPDRGPDGTLIKEIADQAFILDTDYVRFARGCLPGLESQYGIASVDLPSQLEVIGDQAFRYNNLSSLDLPHTIKEIGNLAFNGNQLKSLYLPDSLNKLGDAAFSLNKIEELKLSKSLTEIPDGLFSYNSLEEIDIHEGITRIGKSSLRGNYLKDIDIPDTVTDIADRAFQGNPLERIRVPGSVKNIGKWAFNTKEKHRTIIQVDLGEGIETIGEKAFYNNNLEEVNLPSTVQELGYNAFGASLDLSDPQARSRVVKLLSTNPDQLAFNTSRSLDHQQVILVDEEPDQEAQQEDFIFDEESGTIKSYQGSAKSLVIPEQIKGTPVRAIGVQAFANKDLEELTLPQGLKVIEDRAFMANNIKSLTLPSSVKSIGRLAFASNPDMENLDLNEGLVYLGQQAFKGNSKLKGQLVVPSTLETLMTTSFDGTAIDELYIKGDEDSASLNIKSKINRDLSRIVFQSPYKKARVHFNSFGEGPGDKIIDLGRVQIQASTPEEVLAWIEDNINLDLGASYVNLNDMSGLKDPFAELGVEYDLSNFDKDQAFIVRGTIDRDITLPNKEGYQTPAPASYGYDLQVILQVNLIEDDLGSSEDNPSQTGEDAQDPGKDDLGQADGEDPVGPDQPDPIEPSQPEEPDHEPGPIGPPDPSSDQDDKQGRPSRPDPSFRIDFSRTSKDRKIEEKTQKTPEEKLDEKEPDKDPSLGKPGLEISRTAGSDRYQTAIEISKKLYVKADTVILADGNNYPDSLAAASLAYEKKAPLLLTDLGQLDLVKREIDRLGAKEIIIVGGPASVGADQERAYADLGQVRRIAGEDRYQTAIKIAEEILKANSDQDTVIVASGTGFADALAIASYSARAAMPIILADGDDLPGAQGLLKDYNIQKAIIIGGENSVGQVEGYFASSERIAGINRYKTAIKIAERFFPDTKEIALVSGEKFPDALAVSPLVARENMPVILTASGKLAGEVEDYIQENKIEKVSIFGGENSVSSDMLK